MKKIIAIGAASLMLAACGTDNNGSNNGSNNANNTSNQTNNDNNMSNQSNQTNNGSNNTNQTNNASNNMSNQTNNSTIVPCGDVTFEGECKDATTAQYCDDEFGLIELRCTEDYSPNATCIVVEDYGADCAVPAGESCEIYDEDADEYYYLFCSGNEPACLWSAADTVNCSDDFGTCDADAFTESCEGDNYVYDCSFGQPQAADCVALGGACDAAQGCVMPMDATCDDLILICDAGLTCDIPDDDIVGTCIVM